MKPLKYLFLLVGGIAICITGQIGLDANVNFHNNYPGFQRVYAQADPPPHPVYLPMITNSSGNPQPSNGPEPAQRINAPYFTGAVPSEQSAVFWFGQVDPNKNSADVRIGYNSQELSVNVTVIDRRMWYSTSPSAANLNAYDGVSLFLNTDGNPGSAPTSHSYRFDSQISWFEARPAYQAAHIGNGSGWTNSSASFTTAPGYRGTINQDADGKGWVITYHIPFSSLGMNGAPSTGESWSLGVVVHDRDSQAGPPQPDTNWPAGINANQPVTWGGLNFGLPVYTPAGASPSGNLLLKNKLNGVVVSDASVGGGTNCGGSLDYWQAWGFANYSGTNITERNVQNQSDISDYPCFSKTYITFPLDQVPAGKVILSATLSFHQMGNSDPSGAKPSLIQISMVSPTWNPATINWNNAPQAIENISQAWVDKLDAFPGWPGVERDWDVSRAVSMAYAAGQPLSLALYSADSDYHSGKYFVSSDTGDWNSAARPTLNIVWGQP